MPRRVLPLKPPAHTLWTAAAAFLDRPDLDLIEPAGMHGCMHDDNPWVPLPHPRASAVRRTAWPASGAIATSQTCTSRGYACLSQRHLKVRRQKACQRNSV